MNGLTRMYEEITTFHDTAVDYAMDFIGTTSEEFASEWLMADDSQGVTPSAETDDTSNETGGNVTEDLEAIHDDLMDLMHDFRNNANLKDKPGKWQAKAHAILERHADLVRKQGQAKWVKQAIDGPVFEQRMRAERAEAKVAELKEKIESEIKARDACARDSENKEERIAELQATLDSEREKFYLDLSAEADKVNELKAERDELKRQVDLILENDTAMNGMNKELQARLDEKDAEIDALEAELKLARGEVKTVLNNHAQAERRIKSKEAELDRRLALPHDEELKGRLEHAKGTARYYEGEFKRLCGVLLHIQQVARERKVPDANEDDGR